MADGDGHQAIIPRATYRLQLNSAFTFRNATELIPYLAELGISHLYCSPYFRARPGSVHGYDVVDHNTLNPEIGTAEDFEKLVATLREHGMGHILDFVPNHVGIMGADNTWWMDVLENGKASRYAEVFDIDWSPPTTVIAEKLLVPVLGDPYGTVLERGELQLRYEPEHGSFAVFYFEHRFPIDPQTYPVVLERVLARLPAPRSETDTRARMTATHLAAGPADAGSAAAIMGTVETPAQDTARLELESLVAAFRNLPSRESCTPEQIIERDRDKEIHKRRLAALVETTPGLRAAIDAATKELSGTPDDARSFDALHDLLEKQCYRLAYWRVAADDINYRRFFDVNDLAALRMENDAVFEATHRLALGLVRDGKLDGLRIDHPDGLYDPAGYFDRLQREASPGWAPGSPLPLYVLVEKITASFERLPTSWPVHGTTGYNFTNAMNGVFVDPRAKTRLDRIYRVFIGDYLDWLDVAYGSKVLVLRTSLAAELNVLANQLTRIAQADRHTRDFTLTNLRQALTEVIAVFPVYRTYVTDTASDEDRRYIDWAIGRARRRSPSTNNPMLDFVRSMLLADTTGTEESIHPQVRAFARKFQQVTAPVTAKGVEDTALYRFTRLVSLNEVGGEPDHFGVSVQQFHSESEYRARHWPHEMLGTSTHDTKRAEDVRARIDVLSEFPAIWHKSIQRWSRMNRARRRIVDDLPAPGPHAEYLLYQTLLGTWPLDTLDDEAFARYRERIEEYMVKAAREAKRRTNWANVNEDYESALRQFIRLSLDRREGNLFITELGALARRMARFGFLNSMAQTLCKLTAPGVPDIYQGNEIWDWSLVDPDNRRPVDYAPRQRLLAEVQTWAASPPEELIQHLRRALETIEDGRCKLYLTARALRFRQEHEALFKEGSYLPLKVSGKRASHLLAFARVHDEGIAIVLVPRLCARLLGGREALPLGADVWSDARIELPRKLNLGTLRSVLDGSTTQVEAGENSRAIRAADLLAHFPVALTCSQSSHRAERGARASDTPAPAT